MPDNRGKKPSIPYRCAGCGGPLLYTRGDEEQGKGRCQDHECHLFDKYQPMTKPKP